MIADQPIGEFLDAVASERVTPSGGAVAAVGGAMGAALCEMTCIHTVRGDGSDAADLSAVRDTLADRRAQLLTLADEDAAAVETVQTAFASGDDARVQAALERSTTVPMETAEACLDVVEHAVTVTAAGTPVAVPDAAVGAMLAHAALDGSVSTVRANIEKIADEAFVAEMAGRADEAEAAGEAALSTVRANARP
ncbi:formimidoyltetrahydrofolate cyclodeaminase [Haloarcula rubripromontorii]|uniref:Formimidoyltetrahydrofolate cyclodeaminase n=1 Tax=Haloarcula rubripromontorii TaxID=1705562 RepID=A0A0M9AI18_9EURY|nr:cyclodeaminase/cyclohydrolase family protein [Haloarcula rubripromontorii]KOX92487.1 formimidoyltetrahydrofolate cyclodeaminase [Haloarcula rubripromontorii]